ncbi:MAG: helix-turn-helix transcriptional regulator [Clostridia bacterium]|nr:helix-turn-helix transcriptional regulator [Clostridia bacterium]MBQ6859145.1 helix-turn-helix transcriptional regulator [Clostridia bacterium]MBQ7051578.1 helix-turn-helix transcriptional regulator [Clostridia bacterium]
MFKRIRDLREDHDYTQVDLAKHLHITQAGYSNYETGERSVPAEVLIELARFYHVSVDYLLGETDNPNRYE